MTGEGCLLCARAVALADSDPGWLLRTGHWGVSTHPALPAPGWVAVQTLRHTEGLACLDDAEAAQLGPLLARLSAAVTRVTGSERVYTYSLGEGSPHTHVLLGPPQLDVRGAEFITGLLRRDASLADEAAALSVARDLAGELAAGNTQTTR
jgi:diadenosine tetraphosphate (Ap4A) HIT family hydrolase